MADKLSSHALDWALKHTIKYKDTDIFPFPLEYHAIEFDWNNIKEKLLEIDLSNYVTKPYRSMLAPKKGGYRVIKQLDPIDHLVLTAAVKEYLPQIEGYRIDEAEKIACSYRADLETATLKFFKGDGYQAFSTKTEEYIDSADYDFVLTVDIADFYNQIYLHVVANQLEASGVPAGRSRNIERLLMNLNANKSIGVPVGPFFSIILAELSLCDLDNFLLSKGIIFTRYVDDLRVFCKSEREAQHTLSLISEHLYLNQRLAIQSSKTQIFKIEDFWTKIHFNLERNERENEESKIQALLEEFRENTGYSITEEELPDDQRDQIINDNLKELFNFCLQDDHVEIGVLKYVLRKAGIKRKRLILADSLANLDRMILVYRDFGIYLEKVVNAPSKLTVKEKIEAYLLCPESKYGDLLYQQVWSFTILAHLDVDVVNNDILELAKRSCLREYLLLQSLSNNGAHVIRAYKENWNNFGPWDKRAILFAAHKCLPSLERNVWLDYVNKTGDFLDSSIVKYLKSRPHS